MAGRRVQPLRILVVDDHRAFAEAVAIALSQSLTVEATVATSSSEAVDIAERTGPELVLMDLEMPGVGGIPTIRRILGSQPETRVIVVSGHEDDILKARAMEAGAIGFLAKVNPISEIIRAVARVRDGERLADPDELARLARLLRHRRHQEATQRMRVNRLTPRQVEILQMIAEGMPPKEIAERLGLSPLTLRTHVHNILTRLGVHTKLEAVALVIKHGRVSVGMAGTRPVDIEA
jgi:DNA-binding NarL/FixJ family response regulator